VSEITPERRPANLLPFDYHHEKVALTQMAHWLAEQGWDAKLSVPPKKATGGEDLGGLDPVPLDEAFVERFNGEDWRYRYNFYRDQPGHFDLVARKDGQTLIVDGKGRSATNRRGAVAQMVGGLTLVRQPDRTDLRYAILAPDGAAWDAALRNTGGLGWIELYRIDASGGTITQDNWSRYQTEDSAPA
jgi:hypothetical protein